MGGISICTYPPSLLSLKLQRDTLHELPDKPGRYAADRTEKQGTTRIRVVVKIYRYMESFVAAYPARILIKTLFKSQSNLPRLSSSLVGLKLRVSTCNAYHVLLAFSVRTSKRFVPCHSLFEQAFHVFSAAQGRVRNSL
jgi:hypothetical protein